MSQTYVDSLFAHIARSMNEPIDDTTIGLHERWQATTTFSTPSQDSVLDSSHASPSPTPIQLGPRSTSAQGTSSISLASTHAFLDP